MQSRKASQDFLSMTIGDHKIEVAVVLCSLVVAAVATLALPFLLRHMIDDGISMRSWDELHFWFWALTAAVFFLALSSSVRFYTVSALAEKVVLAVRMRLFQTMVGLDRALHLKTNQAAWLSTMQTDTTLIERLIVGSLSQILRNTIMALGSMIMLWITAWQLALAVIVLVSLLMMPLYGVIKQYRLISQENQLSLEKDHGFVQRVLMGLDFFQIYGQTLRLQQWFGCQLKQTYKVTSARIKLRAWMTFGVMLSVMMVLLMITYIGFYFTMGDIPAMSVGELGQFVIYAALLGAATSSLSEMGSEWARAMGAIDRVTALLSLKDCSNNMSQNTIGQINRVEIKSLSLHINDKAILSDISACLQKGMLSLIGPSGAGKSSLIRLLLRLQYPSQGDILLNDRSLKDYTWQNYFPHCAFCAQGDVIMPMSVRDNIRLGHWSCSDHDILEAAEHAMVMSFVREWPQGLDTMLSEFGHGLSQGMQQRVLIARALVKKAAITVFDEATNAIDAETEAVILENIKRFSTDRIVIFVGHRMSHLAYADQVMLIENGKMVLTGTPKELQSHPAMAQYII